MNKKKIIAASAAFGLAATLFAAAPASAEPVAVGPVVVGSDTLQDVVNALINGTGITGAAVRSLAGTSPAGSYDATGSVTIQTKQNGPLFGRPNGSSDGVKALSRSIDGAAYTAGTPGSPVVANVLGQVDVARSSSGAGTAANPNGPLLYIPFGRDGLSYAHTGSVAAFDNINAATLKGIFECDITTIGGVEVAPVIPQAGSGTRKDFIAKIGTTEAILENSDCLLVGQEHDTSKLQDGTAFPANAVTAMSAAQWVAQNTGAGIDRRGTDAKIGSPISGVSPVTGTGAAMVPNATFYADTTWGRDTYLIVENSRVTVGSANFDAKLANLVSTANSKLGNTGSTNPTQAGSVKKKFGFLAPSNTTQVRANLTS